MRHRDAAVTTTCACLGLLLLGAGAPARPAAEAPSAGHSDLATLQRIRDEGLHRSQVMDTLAYLTDVIGPRLTGSPQMKAANEWTRARLAQWGLANATLESWGPFGPGWSLEHVMVRQAGPTSMPLVAWPKAWSPGTAGLVRGQVLAAKLESESDLAAFKGKLAGRVVLAGAAAEIKGFDKPLLTRRSTEALHESEELPIPGPGSDRFGRFRERRRFGAALQRFLEEERPLCVITPSRREGGVVAVEGVSLRGVDDPRGVTQLVMAAEQYNRLLRLVERGLVVELELDVRVRFHTDDLMAYNTLAEIPGEGPRRAELVMLGAHLDSWHAGTGATDNAAGVAVVMEAARILAAVGARPARTLRVGLWSGEEQGLLGSRAHVARHFGDRPEATLDEPLKGPLRLLPGHARLSAYFNLDNGTGRVRGVWGMENLAALPLLRAWTEPLRDLGVSTVSPRRDFGTDHLPFDAVGLPGFNLMQDEIEYSTLTHHTHLDVYDRAQREDLVQASVALAALVWQAAQHPQRMPRKDPPRPSPDPAASPAPAVSPAPAPSPSPGALDAAAARPPAPSPVP